MSSRLGRPLLFLLLGAQLALLTWQVRRTHGTLGLAGEVTLRLTGPVAHAFRGAADRIAEVRLRAQQRRLLASENAALREEVERLREQRDILKKSLGILCEPPLRGLPKSKS